MLQSLDIPADDTSSAASEAKPVKLNAVVTKGHIRVVPKPGLKVVTTGKADTISPDVSPTQTVRSEPETVAPDSLDLEVTPAAPAPSVPWNDGFSEAPREAQSIESELLPSQGPSMKMIKLIAAATVLGVAAIALTFLQFFGSEAETQGEGQVATQSFSPVISAADASTLPANATSATDGNSADIVAQITAGTLAALRNGSTETSSTGVAATPTAMGEGNGLYAMVLTALEQGQSRQYIDQMVNDAHRSQQVEVPAVLLTSSGEVNTGALLTLFGGQ